MIAAIRRLAGPGNKTIKNGQLLSRHRPRSIGSSSSKISRHHGAAAGFGNSYNGNNHNNSGHHHHYKKAWGTLATAATAATAALAMADTDDDNNNSNNIICTSTARFLLSLPGTLTSPVVSSCFGFGLKRNTTAATFEEEAEKELRVRDVYDVDWKRPLGEGGFGAVFRATHRETGEAVALKQMSKKFTDDDGFKREMDAFLHLRESGGHPNICQMYQNFDEGNYYLMTLDLISGGEMFDHLVRSGPYSEGDASRLIREVASALAFMHGIGMVHGDMKPENIMLSTKKKSDSAVKVIDFGCAQITPPEREGDPTFTPGVAGLTVAYCPPEILAMHPKKRQRITPQMDMWALGIILHIMLVGCNPFDLRGVATDKVLMKRIRDGETPKTLLPNSRLTKHLSESALDLIRSLLDKDPEKRITAQQMLQHPWVLGETASSEKLKGSDEKLSKFRAYKSSLEARVFADIVEWSDDAEMISGDGDGDNKTSKRTSLIERSFRKLDESHKGYITAKDLEKSTGAAVDKKNAGGKLSLTAFETLISDHMKDSYFAKDEVIFEEGDVGDYMLFINSGLLEVSTKDGFAARLQAGQYVGEGALLSDNNIRGGTLKCLTPVHAIRISKEYFEKYMKGSGEGHMDLKMREKDKQRAIDRTTNMLQKQKCLKPKSLEQGEKLYNDGDPGDEMFLIEEGKIDLVTKEGGHKIASLYESEFVGVDALLLNRPRNSDAVCDTGGGCLVHYMKKGDFASLLNRSSNLKTSMEDFFLRKEFQKAVTNRIRRDFPTTVSGLEEVFESLDAEGKGYLSRKDIQTLLKEFDPNATDDVVAGILNTLDIDHNGTIEFEEFVQIFDMNKNRKAKKYETHHKNDVDSA